jgi:methylglutaconyl-CoA hydratase
MPDHVLESLAEGIFTLTLNRPEKRNALDRESLDRLAHGIARAELEPAIRVVVIRGAGRDFCAGADLNDLLASVDRSADENERDALSLGELFLAFRRLPKPVVAVVTGRALAGGAGLATACDIVLAAESATFGYPEIERGFVPAMVMTVLRRAVGEKRAFDLVATGRVISAAEAAQIGLISRVVPDAEIESVAGGLGAALARQSATAFALTKQLFVELDDRNFGDGILLGARVNAIARGTEDFRRSVAGFLAR